MNQPLRFPTEAQLQSQLQLVLQIAAPFQGLAAEPVLKGWSDDHKFIVHCSNGAKLQLRLSALQGYAAKQQEFERIQAVASLGLNSSQALGFGLSPDGQQVYLLLSWVEGQDAEAVVPSLSPQRQYTLGYQAGQALQQIHHLPAKRAEGSWKRHYTQRIARKLATYRASGLELPEAQQAINFLENQLSHFPERPLTLQHGDYHLGNLLINDRQELGIIDFNRSSEGDPWEEYDRFIFSWSKSPAFAVGQLHGYFQGEPPQDFFVMLAIYQAAFIVGSIPWAIPFGEQELQVMVANARQIAASYRGFTTLIPDWYPGHEHRHL